MYIRSSEIEERWGMNNFKYLNGLSHETKVWIIREINDNSRNLYHQVMFFLENRYKQGIMKTAQEEALLYMEQNNINIEFKLLMEELVLFCYKKVLESKGNHDQNKIIACVASLIFFFPIGLWYMHRKNIFGVKGKCIVWSIIIILSIFSLTDNQEQELVDTESKVLSQDKTTKTNEKDTQKKKENKEEVQKSNDDDKIKDEWRSAVDPNYVDAEYAWEIGDIIYGLFDEDEGIFEPVFKALDYQKDVYQEGAFGQLVKIENAILVRDLSDDYEWWKDLDTMFSTYKESEGRPLYYVKRVKK